MLKKSIIQFPLLSRNKRPGKAKHQLIIPDLLHRKHISSDLSPLGHLWRPTPEVRVAERTPRHSPRHTERQNLTDFVSSEQENRHATATPNAGV